MECLLTPGDYELLCRKQDEGRLMKQEINDEGDSGKFDSDTTFSDDASVKINSEEEEIVVATVQENKPEMTMHESKPEIKENEPRNKQDETVEQTNSKCDSHDSMSKNFVDVDRSTDGVVRVKSDSTVVQQTVTRKNPDSDEEVHSRLSETGIEPRSDILIEQLNGTAIEADTDNPEQLQSLVLLLNFQLLQLRYGRTRIRT